ncbi:hypothetical protein NPIL_248461 [Nephila pilipes]|uniref:Uncharacterized protein n=1 Tax=Nephila pilipes TaxID=299642 RepID=A0A8X6TVJ2_NEPPI|nr:hypothetical protein NPIL_248461 [Nephila pilipes]
MLSYEAVVAAAAAPRTAGSASSEGCLQQWPASCRLARQKCATQCNGMLFAAMHAGCKMRVCGEKCLRLLCYLWRLAFFCGIQPVRKRQRQPVYKWYSALQHGAALCGTRYFKVPALCSGTREMVLGAVSVAGYALAAYEIDIWMTKAAKCYKIVATSKHLREHVHRNPSKLLPLAQVIRLCILQEDLLLFFSLPFSMIL